MLSATRWLDSHELAQQAHRYDVAARGTLISAQWKQPDQVAEYLNPAGATLKIREAKKACSPDSARLFIKLTETGEVPHWALQVVDFDLIRMAAA